MKNPRGYDTKGDNRAASNYELIDISVTGESKDEVVRKVQKVLELERTTYDMQALPEPRCS